MVLDHVEAGDRGFGEVLEADAGLEELEPDGDGVGLARVLERLRELAEVHETHGEFVVVAALGEDLARLLEQLVVDALLADHLPVHVDVVVDELVEVERLVQFRQREQQHVVDAPVPDPVVVPDHAQVVHQLRLRFHFLAGRDYQNLLRVVLGLHEVLHCFFDHVFVEFLLGQPGVALRVFGFVRKLDCPDMVVEVCEQNVDCVLVVLVA